MPIARPTRSPAASTDFIIGGAVLDKIDPSGRLLYTVKADEVRHFPDDETSELTRPNVVYSPVKRPPMTMNADFGRISENGDVVDLSGNVKIVRAASGKDEALTATTSQLTVLTNEEKAYTRAPAQIVQGKSWITGVGMRLDQRAQTYVIEAQARAVLESKTLKRP